MRRRRVVVSGLLLVGLALWWAWPEAREEEPARAEAKAERKVSRFDQRLAASRARLRQLPPERPVEAVPPPEEDADARACALCAEGVLTGEICDLVCAGDDEGWVELAIDVVDEAGRPEDRARVTVRGCKVEGKPSGGVFRVAEGECTVQAWRRDGALFARSEEVTVQVRPGDTPYVQLELESARTGGLGVSIGEDPEGIRVLAVMPGTPAAELGLAPGDLILQVDGVDTVELDLHGFIQTMTGPEGTDVDFVVRHPDGMEEPLAITRRFIDRS